MTDHQVIKAGLDWMAGLSVVGALIGVLPSIAALMGVIWYSVLLYDRFVNKRKVNENDSLPND